MKTNRMGQRARRKQWMKQYGRDAKHLKPEQGKSKGSQRMGKQNKLANQDHKRPSTNKDTQATQSKGGSSSIVGSQQEKETARNRTCSL